MPRPAMRTFLFSDIRDYTLFVETRGDDAATKMIRASRRIIRAEVARHRGAEIKTEGDSFYVVFRSPSAALRCAIAVQRAAATHNERHPGLPVHLGIGINTGEAVPHDKGYVGSAVVVAQRLTASARAGQILVTDTVRSLVRTGAHASMRELGTWTVKGITEGIRVYEVEVLPTAATRTVGPTLRMPAVLLEPRPTGAAGIVACPELVQREGELGALLEHLAAAARGESRFIAMGGEGGIGKSRLCREVARLADADGFYVLGGRSFGPSDAPYEPFIASLRPYARARGTEVLRRLLGGLVLELRRLLPELEVRPEENDASIPDDERRDRFFRTIQLLLEDAASLRPVLLVLEDYQYADAATRDLLRYLVSTLRVGICVLLPYREEELGPAHPVRALLADLERQRALANLKLRPLDRDGVARMVSALVPGPEASVFFDLIAERSEGVPFYVEELVKSALALGAGAGRSLPRTVRDSVHSRVARLVAERGQSVADLLEAAAIAAVPLGYDLLVRLSERDEQTAALDVAAAVEAQLLECAPTVHAIYRFHHALTQEAIADAISPARRRRLARRVAEALEASGSTAEHAAQLARHFAAAGETEKAVRYARIGAERAVTLGAYGTAIEQLQVAAAYARDTAMEGAVTEELAVALQAAGRAAEAEDAIGRAQELAARLEDVPTLARLDIRLGAVLQMQGRHAEAVATAQRAVAALERHPGESLAEAVCSLANLEWITSDAEKTARLARRALTIARKYRSPRITAAALALLGAALARLRDPEGTEKLREAIALAVAQGAPVEAANAYVELVRAERHVGRWDSAKSAAESGLALARQRGLEFVQSRLLSELASNYVTMGRYGEARAVAEQAVAVAKPETVAATTAKATLALVLSWQGEPDAALALLDQVATDASGLDADRRALYLATYARTLLGLGRLDEADVSARKSVALALSATPGGLGPTAFIVACDVAEARREPARLRELLSELDRSFKTERTAVIDVVRREIRAALSAADGESAAEGFADVARSYRELGVPVRAAYRRACAAVAEIAAGARARSIRRDIASARAELVERGALSYVRVIDAALARSAGKPTIRERLSSGSLLRGRELRVAVLVSRGLTDSRIAADLSVERAEATRLVRRVLRTLGVRSRAQIASWVVQRHQSDAQLAAR